jgi:hypothetical protein
MTYKIKKNGDKELDASVDDARPAKSLFDNKFKAIKGGTGSGRYPKGSGNVERSSYAHETSGKDIVIDREKVPLIKQALDLSKTAIRNLDNAVEDARAGGVVGVVGEKAMTTLLNTATTAVTSSNELFHYLDYLGFENLFEAGQLVAEFTPPILAMLKSERDKSPNGKPMGEIFDDALKGGSGSGNFGHEGRQGQVGGSGDDGEGKNADGSERTKYERPIPIHVKTVEEAIQLVLQGKVVEVDNVRQVNTMLNKLAAMANEAKALGQKAPEYDLCNVSVAGTNLFCGSSLRTEEYPEGIPRLEMPQMSGRPIAGSFADLLPRSPWAPEEVDGASHFVSHLHGLGIKVSSQESVPAASLKASQAQLVGAKVASMMTNTKFDPSVNPIFISRDNYVVDGHHRWAAVVGRDAGSDHPGSTRMNVIRIDAPISEVLKIGKVWMPWFGILPEAGPKKSIGEFEWISRC